MTDSLDDALASGQITLRGVHIVTAATALAATPAPNWDMLGSTWVTLGCEEIEAVAALFRATGYDTLAAACIYDHAQDDEGVADHPVDQHWQLRGLDWPTARRLIGY